jgi:multiple sugar transport system ATP-binding protein
MVFQDFALYSHLTVAQNLAFGLSNQGARGSGERVGEVARRLGIEPLLNRYPAELSGGEQQRVALGRAMARQPAALLMDEPLASLDPPLRWKLRQEVTEFQRQLGVPTIYVTHDPAEALALGDRIAVIEKGVLQQVGLASEVRDRPINQFVTEFFEYLK